MQKVRYYGEINFTIDKDHPDRKHVPDWTEEKILNFSDTYTFDYGYYETEEIKEYIKRDLMLVTGGGYNTKHIHNTTFNIRQL